MHRGYPMPAFCAVRIPYHPRVLHRLTLAAMNILGAIGNTSLVRLRKVVPRGCAEILAKLERENPTGSLKDRMAQAVTGRARQDRRVNPGDTVAEYSGGGTPARA